jgi:hypothetical protein
MQQISVRKFAWLFSLVVFAALAGGCKKQVAATPPSAAPVPTPQPTVTLNASPATVSPGQTVTL